MVNCNPETVSTDYDTSDRLYFEPLTLEDVLEIVHAEEQAGPVAGVICQLGGQTPLGLAQGLKDNGVTIVGTSPEAIHLAEERGAFGRVLAEAGLPAPKHGMATSFADAKRIADEIGYPVLVRPSYVLGGRGMEIVYDDEALERLHRSGRPRSAPSTRCWSTGSSTTRSRSTSTRCTTATELFLGGVMEHIEEAGIHSGDSSCALPPITLGAAEIERIREATEAIARGVGVLGLLNIQFALGSDVLYVLEANPRASRTVPFVSKATATPLAKAAARVMLGRVDRRPARRRRAACDRRRRHAARRPADRGQGGGDAVQPVPHPRRQAGRHRARPGDEVDRRGDGPRRRLRHRLREGAGRGVRARCRPAAGSSCQMANRDKRHMIFPIKVLADHGFEILATQGTAEVLRRNGVAGDRGAQALRGPGPERRADHRAADPGRRDPAGHQHARRLDQRRLGAHRRLRDPHGRGAAPTSRASPPCRGSAPPCRASRR